MATANRNTGNTATLSPATAAESDFVITRLINAPRELVFKAWTDPKYMSQWWGPRGFTNPVCELDVRTGGTYRITMRSPEGVDYPLKGVYREVAQNERLQLTDNWEDHPSDWQDLFKKYLRETGGKPARESSSTVTFEDSGGKTNLTIRAHFDSAAVRDAMLKMGMNEGWAQSLDRLEELLATQRGEGLKLRNGSAVWKGGLKDGRGTVSTASGALTNAQYSFNTRFAEGKGTNPEELIAAAHAGCFSMALSGELEKAGLTAESIKTTASVTLKKTDAGFTITAVHLNVTGKVPGASRQAFETAAGNAKAGCPVSRLLNATITMETRLE